MQSISYQPSTDNMQRVHSTSDLRMMAQMTTDPAEIVPDFLYLGSLRSAADLYILHDLHITRIVNLSGFHNLYPTVFTYRTYDVEDSEDANIISIFEDVVDFIRDARETHERVLVHCMAGVSRSTSVVLAYLMKEEGLKMDEAFALVKSKRPVVKPNPGFLSQLRKYECEVRRMRELELELELELGGEEVESDDQDDGVASLQDREEDEEKEEVEAFIAGKKVEECERHSYGHYLAYFEEEEAGDDDSNSSLAQAREV